MPVYNNDIDLESHLEMLSFQVAFYNWNKKYDKKKVYTLNFNLIQTNIVKIRKKNFNNLIYKIFKIFYDNYFVRFIIQI